MPTYGAPETAKEHPPTPKVKALLEMIRGHRRELAALETSLRIHAASCEHHFTPSENAFRSIRPSVKAGIAYVGEGNSFLLICAHCGESKIALASAHCPLCAHPLDRRYGDTEKEVLEYLHHFPGLHYALVHLSCLACGYKAVTLEWDR